VFDASVSIAAVSAKTRKACGIGLLFLLILAAAAFLRVRRMGSDSLTFDEQWHLELSTGRGSPHVRLPQDVLIADAPDVTSLKGAPPVTAVSGTHRRSNAYRAKTSRGDKIPLAKPHLFDVETKEEIHLSDELFENPWSITHHHWTPDSKRFFFLYNQRGHTVMRIGLGNVLTTEKHLRNVWELIQKTTNDL